MYLTKGIILAGGNGSRLHPFTMSVSKQLLPVYDKPMIYYPLSVLMLAGINDILIITTPEDQYSFLRLLGDGSQFGIKLSYLAQTQPEGLAQGLIIAEEFVGSNPVALALGDNIFWGNGLSAMLRRAVERSNGATVFGYQVNDPERFGVIEFDQDFRVISLEEKPKFPKSNYAVAGLYFYDEKAVELAKTIGKSPRGEFELTSLNNMYMRKGNLHVELMGRGFAWLDAGTPDSLLEASIFVETVEKRQGYKIACLEEISWRNGWINSRDLAALASDMCNQGYAKYLTGLLAHEGQR